MLISSLRSDWQAIHTQLLDKWRAENESQQA
jgi:hypothetical protein